MNREDPDEYSLHQQPEDYYSDCDDSRDSTIRTLEQLVSKLEEIQAAYSCWDKSEGQMIQKQLDRIMLAYYAFHANFADLIALLDNIELWFRTAMPIDVVSDAAMRWIFYDKHGNDYYVREATRLLGNFLSSSTMLLEHMDTQAKRWLKQYMSCESEYIQGYLDEQGKLIHSKTSIGIILRNYMQHDTIPIVLPLPEGDESFFMDNVYLAIDLRAVAECLDPKRNSEAIRVLESRDHGLGVPLRVIACEHYKEVRETLNRFCWEANVTFMEKFIEASELRNKYDRVRTDYRVE